MTFIKKPTIFATSLIFKDPLSGLKQFPATESPLKMMKYDFYFNSICSQLYLALTFLVLWKNNLIRKLRLISKFMTTQPWKQTITIYIFPNI